MARIIRKSQSLSQVLSKAMKPRDYDRTIQESIDELRNYWVAVGSRHPHFANAREAHVAANMQKVWEAFLRVLSRDSKVWDGNVAVLHNNNGTSDKYYAVFGVYDMDGSNHRTESFYGAVTGRHVSESPWASHPQVQIDKKMKNGYVLMPEITDRIKNQLNALTNSGKLVDADVEYVEGLLDSI